MLKLKSKNPLISIVITTKNEEAVIGDLLGTIKKQTYKNFEIIVVDNNSTDKTVEIAKRYTKLVFNKGPERSAQRNFGAKNAKGDYLFFLDSDMVLSKNVIKECVEKYQSGIGGIIIPERSYGIGFWARVKGFERQINEGEPYFEAARFFPKKVFWGFKGYDERLTGPEDWDLPQRISKKLPLARIKSYILHNEGKRSLLNLAKKKFYYGLSVHRYLKKQNLSIFSPVTVYFLRPAFYKNWQRLISNPLLSLGLVVMLSFEMIGGGLGYLIGRFRK